MNHQLAVDTRATERYMLDELDDESRLAFEEHYFSCRVCADDVRAAAQFLDNAKAVMRAEGNYARSTGFAFGASWHQVRRLAIPMALAACLAIGYMLPHPGARGISGGGVVASFAVPAGVRGASVAQANSALASGDASVLLLRLDVADGVTAPRLLWRVKAGASTELRFQTAREAAVTLPLAAADFPAGRYEVVLSADTPGAPVLDRYPFEIAPR